MFVRSPRPAMRSMSPSILTPLRFVRITHGSVTFITRALMAAKAWSFRMLKRLSRCPSTMNAARDITLAKLSSMIAFRLLLMRGRRPCVQAPEQEIVRLQRPKFYLPMYVSVPRRPTEVD